MIRRSLNFGGWMAIDRAGAMVGSLVGQLLIARSLGPAGTGDINALLAMTAILAPISQLGIGWHAARAIRDSPADEAAILCAGLAWRLIGASLAMVSLIVIGLLLTPNAETRLAWFVLALAQLPSALSVVEMRYHADLSLGRLVPWKLGVVVLALLAKLVVALLNPTVNAFVMVLAAETAALGIVCASLYRHHTGFLLTSAKRTPWLSWFGRRAPLLTLAGVAEYAHLKIDVLMLTLMLGSVQAGLYSAAARVSEAWYALAIVASAVMVNHIWRPEMSAEQTAQRLQVGFDGLFSAGLLVAVCLSVFSSELVAMLFGSAFAQSAGILAIHVWAGVFMFMRALLSRWLVENDLPALSLLSHASALCVNVALNLLLIPRWGGVGAAIATVVSCAMSVWLSMFFVDKSRVVARHVTRAMLLPCRWRDLTRYARHLAQEIVAIWGRKFG